MTINSSRFPIYTVITGPLFPFGASLLAKSICSLATLYNLTFLAEALAHPRALEESTLRGMQHLQTVLINNL
jgi:hypothetical protein